MVVHNPPLHDSDMPDHEHYATEGKTKMYRPKHSENPEEWHRQYKELGKKARETAKAMQEHEHPYWSGDHS